MNSVKSAVYNSVDYYVYVSIFNSARRCVLDSILDLVVMSISPVEIPVRNYIYDSVLKHEE